MKTKYKLVPIEPTCEMIHAGQMAVSGFPRDVLECWQAMLAAAPEVNKVGFCEDTALSLAEDVIQHARRLHGMYTAPQQVSSIKCPGAGCTGSWLPFPLRQ